MALNRRRRVLRVRVVAGIAGLAFVAAAVVATSGSSSADADLGTLVLSPHTGTATTANINLSTISQLTPAGCPVTAAQATVTVSGPGGWAGGLAFTAYRSLTPGSEQVIPMSPTFADVASANGTTIEAGRYDITVACKDRLGASSFGTFTASIWFTDASDWQDSDPTTSTTVTQIAVQDSPVGRATTGEPITLTATITPGNAVGQVRFLDVNGTATAQVGSAVTVVGGQAKISISTLQFGLHYFSATFGPSDPSRFAPSSTAAPPLNFVVAHPSPDGSGG